MTNSTTSHDRYYYAREIGLLESTSLSPINDRGDHWLKSYHIA